MKQVPAVETGRMFSVMLQLLVVVVVVLVVLGWKCVHEHVWVSTFSLYVQWKVIYQQCFRSSCSCFLLLFACSWMICHDICTHHTLSWFTQSDWFDVAASWLWFSHFIYYDCILILWLGTDLPFVGSCDHVMNRRMKMQRQEVRSGETMKLSR